MTRAMPEFHRPMLAYIEKQKRKSENKKQKDRLLALMGKEEGKAVDQTPKEDGEEDSDEFSSDEEANEIAKKKDVKEDEDSEDSGSDSDIEARG